MQDLLPELGSRLLVIYDGRCGLCNRSVRWFLRRDTRDCMRFIPSESPRVAALLARSGFASPALPDGPTTILVVRGFDRPSEQVFARSTAILAMLVELPSPWPSIATLFRIIPRPLRDLAYRFIARIRYRVWGHYDTCPLPTPVERARFL